WKSLPGSRERLICQSPVTPGRTDSRASRQAGLYWFSLYGLGRGPTTDICPARTLKNLGSSAMLVFRDRKSTRLNSSHVKSSSAAGLFTPSLHDALPISGSLCPARGSV